MRKIKNCFSEGTRGALVSPALFFAISPFSNARAASGVLVGNGAGIVEQNIFYAYDALPKAIANCLDAPLLCSLAPNDVTVLKQIQAIAQDNPSTPERIQFGSEAATPGFFDTEVGQAYRLAKTGLTSQTVIYWNRDQFYNNDGTPALDIPAISAIWVHELGHQAGLLDHAYLDQLGAHVRVTLMGSYYEVHYSAPQGQGLVLTGIDYPGARPGDLYVDDGAASFSLGNEITQAAHCPTEGAPVVGWSITNAHWAEPLLQAESNSNNGFYALPFAAWLQLDCLDGDKLDESELQLNVTLLFKNTGGSYRYSRSNVSLAPLATTSRVSQIGN